jgi:predicted Rossmann fold flavoprotein
MPDLAGLVVVGGGAAGLACAAACGRIGVRALVLEKTDGCGRKLALAGGRRGNFTHAIPPRDMAQRFDCDRTWLLPLLRRFPYQRITGFFHSLGIDHRTDDDGCVWPIRSNAAGLRDALLREATRHGPEVRTNCAVRSIAPEHGRFRLALADGSSLLAARVLISTGGASYPHTGSTGDGLILARSLGLAVVNWFPALASLRTEESLRHLAGITQEKVTMTVLVGSEPVRTAQGHFIFAHDHVSGSSVLNLCGYAARALAEKRPVILRVDWVPDVSISDLSARFRAGRAENPRQQVATSLCRFVSRRLADLLCHRAQVLKERRLTELCRDEAARLCHVLKQTDFTVTGTEPMERATASGGGVSLSEVDNARLEAHRLPGLFLAGEVLDVWGETGGYNLHFAWATGLAVAEAVSGRKL